MNAIPKIQPASEQERKPVPLVDALRDLLDHVDRNTCTHENTHRGGFLWTICDECGQQWADDRGGFVPYVDPEPVAVARAVLSTFAHPQVEPVSVSHPSDWTLEPWQIDDFYFGLEPRKSTLPTENDCADFDGSEWRLP